MTKRGSELEINDFSGGLHTAIAITETNFNEAYDESNMVVGPNGDYLRTRYGNTVFNSSDMNSGANVQSLSYFKLNNGNDFLVSVCGNKIFKSDSLDGVMDDITGAVSITSGANNIWSFLTFNNLHIGFGGPSTNPDTPIQWTGSGNAAALTGTPPAAYGAFQANNRLFAFRTASSPSILQWSTLGNPQDWTGTGSGSQTISTSDNDSITAAAVMDNSLALIFKQTTIHKLLISQLVSGAFPSFVMFRNVGCAGKHAVVVADGICYFMTPQGKMKITDGNQMIDESTLPQLSYVDDLWSDMNPSRYEYIQGRRVYGEDYDHIIWLMTSTSSGLTHDTAIIWDIKNKCWLRHKTGFKMNVITTIQSGTPYTGNYSGFIYKQDVSSATTDASESSTNINSYWGTGWMKFGSYEKNKSVQELYLSYVTQISGTIQYSWGYNFNGNQKTSILDQRTNGAIVGQSTVGTGIVGGQSDFIKRLDPIGNGEVFQHMFRNTDSRMKINSYTMVGKEFSKQS